MIPGAFEHAMREYPREACGLVVLVDGSHFYMPCRNLADAGDHFVMDPMGYMEADERGEIVAVVHSHPDGPALPSSYDIAAQQATGLPWHIVSVPSGEWHTFGDH